MADPIWVDGTTPLNAANMTKLQTRDEKGAPSGYVALNGSSGIDLAAAAIVKWGGDTNLSRFGAGVLVTDGGFYVRTSTAYLGLLDPAGGFLRWNVAPNGTVQWGPGNGASDTNLFRVGPNSLRTDGGLTLGGSIFSDGYILASSDYYLRNNSGHIYFGANDDAQIQRWAAGQLRTPGDFLVGQNIYAGTTLNAPKVNLTGTAAGDLVNVVFIGGEGSGRFYQRADGTMWWGTGSGGVYDVSIQRWAAGKLNLQSTLMLGLGTAPGTSGLEIYANAPQGIPVLGLTNQGYINFGPGTAGTDTNLYRQSASNLKTDSNFLVGAQYLQVGHSVSSGNIIFGSAQDTFLYRASVGVLKTDGAIATLSYGTTLPAAPVDGQEFTLVDSLTAPTYQWRFRFNAGSSSSYKWEFIGGSPYESEVDGVSTLSSTAFAIPSAGGPGLTVPRSGEYLIEFGCLLYISTGTAGAQLQYGPRIGATDPTSTYDTVCLFTGTNIGTMQSSQARSRRKTITAGTTIQMVWNVAGGSVQSMYNQFFKVTPLRVS